MMIAASDYEKEIILDIIKEYAADCNVLAFGSRYKWTNKEYSDLDLVFVKLDGGKLGTNRVYDIKEAFEESNLPFKVDVLDYHAVPEYFVKHIDAGNVMIYEGGGVATTTLSELCVGGGSYGIAASAVEKSDSLPTYLRITDINDDGTINFDGLKSVDHKKSEKYMLEPNDIVFARTGGSTGRNYFYDGRDGEFVYAGFLIKFSIDATKCNPKFIKYYCQTQAYKEWVQSFNTGSTRGNINAKTYAAMPIPNISREQQDLIVNTLSPLDDKIENNKKISQKLEEIAQAIFKSWFVDFEPWGGVMPDDWREAALSEIATIIMGQSPAGSTYNEEGSGTVFYQGRAEFGWRFPTQRLYTTDPKRMAEKNDIMMSVRAPVGDLNIATESCCIGRGLAAVRSKNQCQSFLLYTMFALKEVLDRFNGEGTVFGSINKTDMANLLVLMPSLVVIQSFEEKVKKLDSKIKNNHLEICELQELRDKILAELLS